jgi:hypothetical protein
MNATDIVGYGYNADIVCDDHMREIAIAAAQRAGDATAWGDTGSAEDAIRTWAALVGVDYTDEESYDSGDFPKVIFADWAHNGCTADNGYPSGTCADRCGICHEPLSGSCPNIPE